jgi:hypothetical protein
MTIHLPGRAAPAPEISSDLSRILADQAERDAAEVALHARNKEALYRQLEQEYEHLTSDEAVDETLVVGGYTFTEEGRRFG